MHKTFFFAGMTALAIAALPALAATLDTPGTTRQLSVPAAAGNSHVISLGEAVDPATGKTVEGYSIIHYKKGYHHKDGHGGGPGNGGPGNGGDDSGSTCYAFLANGVKWKTTEPYLVDPSNNAGLGSTTVFSLMGDALTAWDTEVAFDIFGGGAYGGDGPDSSSPDGKNEVSFGDIDSTGAIGVTTVWGIFRGRPSDRELVEWDMVFDDADFAWSTDGSAGTMDFLNIATHEAGHAGGMGHPDDSCTEETMYAFAATGETKKRTLEAGDIAGVNDLY